MEPASPVKCFKASVSSYEPDTASAELLISKVDALLAAGGNTTKATLTEYLETIDRTTWAELFALDVSRQLCCSLLQRRESVQKLLASADPRASGVSLDQVTAVADLHLFYLQVSSSEDTIMAKV
ncbi:hypothetical protein H0H92_010248 [Tricholoma furcatifolium]|nr:hypothetical protein H0H92_010248 [Tricholoma furcatifolium]